MNKKILLVLSGSGTPDEAITHAAGRAKKEGATLVALYVLESAQSKEAFETFTDIGFIGDKPSSDISESLMREYRQRGYEELGRVQIKAMEAGVNFEPLMEEGEFISIVLDVIDRLDIGAVVLIKPKEKASFMKYFSKSIVDTIKERAKCDVEIFVEK
ncbi:MAG: universal stress protein [Deltaproteobacteria bacterium]|nr:universal stress protein [Deltaproteobacteria bacterium]